MFKTICITDRKICNGNFFEKIEKACNSGVSEIILREKDLDISEYATLYNDVNEICKNYKIPLFAHGSLTVAAAVNSKHLHLPFSEFVKLSEEIKNRNFIALGTSVHSTDEAVAAASCGADYIIVGHIFETDCKAGLKPKGTEFLREVCDSVSIPVYAIGGIKPSDYPILKDCGAKGACIRSKFMRN